MIVPALSSRRLFGRSDELQLLHETRRALASGHGRVVLVGGEAGIGKTRLLSEFAAGLTHGRAPHYALGECLQDAPRPFGPFRAIIAKLMDLAPAVPEPIAPLIRRTLGALVPDAAEARGLRVDPPVVIEKAELFTGVLRYLESVAAKRATVLALEDVHWADSGTLELLAHIAPRIAGTRLMIVVTYRADEIHTDHPFLPILARLSREPTVRQVVLEPLMESEVRALIDDALGTKYALDAAHIRDVVLRGEGNPFFTEEILKKTLEQQSAAGDGGLPISIRAMILERLAGLRDGDRRILDHAAVLGQQFDVDTLAAATSSERPAVLQTLHRLRGLNLIVEEGARSSRFRFRHALTRQTIYDELLSVDTLGLHARMVAYFETIPDGDATVDDLAYHAWKAGLRESTFRYSERAGDAALAVRAAAQAATYYERALEFAADEDARLRLLGKAGDAYTQQSDFDRATAACLALHSMLLERGDYDRATFALTRASGELANAGKTRAALEMLEAFDSEYRARLTQATADHLQASVARIATSCDEFDRAAVALGQIRRPDLLGAFSHQVYRLAQLFCAEHEIDASLRREAADALRLRNAETYPLMRSQMLHSIASTAIQFAANEEAEAAVSAAIAIDREHGFNRAFAYASAVKACVLCVRGRLAEARACMEEALAEPDMFVVRLELALGASPTAIALGDDDLARRCLDEDLLRHIRDGGMAEAASLLTGMRAAWLLSIGRVDEGRALAERAVDGEQHQFAVIHFWPFAARHVDRHRLDRLRSLCAVRGANPDDRVAHACGALLDAIAARRSAARVAGELAELAVERYRALGWPLHEAHALEVAGRIDASLALYRAAGSVADVRRLEIRRPATASRKGVAGGLSPREREVATLVAAGLTNRNISAELCVSEKTVEKYITAIYAKLSFSTRAQLAAHMARSEPSG